MHENQGEGCYCRSLNEKGKKRVGFASNETIQELCTHLTASGNDSKVVELWGFCHVCVVGLLFQTSGS